MDEKTKALTDAIVKAVTQFVGQPAEPEQKALPLDDKGAEAKPTETPPANPPAPAPTSTGKETSKTEGEKTGNITITADALTQALSEAIKQNAPAVGAPNTGGQALTLDAIKGMSEADINANWDAVSKVLADSRTAQQ